MELGLADFVHDSVESTVMEGGQLGICQDHQNGGDLLRLDHGVATWDAFDWLAPWNW